jgi:hypothetical protein
MAWGGHWEKYGEAWTKDIEKIDPKPDRILIISDRPIDTQWEVILTDTPEKYDSSHYRNVAVDNTDTDWIVGSDIDDHPYVNFLAGVDNDYDICAHSLDRSDGIYEMPNKSNWDKLLESDRYMYSIASSVPIKTELIKKVGGYPKTWHEDAGLWIKLRFLDPKVKFDSTPRYMYVIHEHSLSHGDVQHKEDDLVEFFNFQKSLYNSKK